MGSTLATWLVTGSSRGLGLELCKQILTSSSSDIVFASCRDPEKATKLQELQANSRFKDRVYIVTMDVTDEASIEAAAATVGETLKEKNLRLDYLLNNAAAYFAFDKILTMRPDHFQDTMAANVLGPALTAQHFMQYLERPPSTQQSKRQPVVMNMSSALGSLAADVGTFVASYSISKTAINMVTYKLSREKPNLTVISMDPGHNKTDMGGPMAAGDPAVTINRMLKTLRSLSPADSGRFKRFDGSYMPW